MAPPATVIASPAFSVITPVEVTTAPELSVSLSLTEPVVPALKVRLPPVFEVTLPSIVSALCALILIDPVVVYILPVTVMLSLPCKDVLPVLPSD